MLNNIKYVYGKNKDSEAGEFKKALEGAIVYRFDGEKTFKQEIYVGIQFDLEDILNNDINARCLNITDLERFKNVYKSVNASGIVYFPDTDKFGFLQEGDIVLPWFKTETVSETLENALQVYRNEAVDAVVMQKYEERMAYLKNLDADDSLAEIMDIKLQRRVSSR